MKNRICRIIFRLISVYLIAAVLVLCVGSSFAYTGERFRIIVPSTYVSGVESGTDYYWEAEDHNSSIRISIEKNTSALDISAMTSEDLKGKISEYESDENTFLFHYGLGYTVASVSGGSYFCSVNGLSAYCVSSETVYSKNDGDDTYVCNENTYYVADENNVYSITLSERAGVTDSKFDQDKIIDSFRIIIPTEESEIQSNGMPTSVKVLIFAVVGCIIGCGGAYVKMNYDRKHKSTGNDSDSSSNDK